MVMGPNGANVGCSTTPQTVGKLSRVTGGRIGVVALLDCAVGFRGWFGSGRARVEGTEEQSCV